jgi:hypothetical protein
MMPSRRDASKTPWASLKEPLETCPLPVVLRTLSRLLAWSKPLRLVRIGLKKYNSIKATYWS